MDPNRINLLLLVLCAVQIAFAVTLTVIIIELRRLSRLAGEKPADLRRFVSSAPRFRSRS